jgi:hypothetical protein
MKWSKLFILFKNNIIRETFLEIIIIIFITSFS